MVELGRGACYDMPYAGWDAKAIYSLAKCKQLCLQESRCTHVSYLWGISCNRYDKLNCHLTNEQMWITFKKSKCEDLKRNSSTFSHFDYQLTVLMEKLQRQKLNMTSIVTCLYYLVVILE